MNTIMTAFYTMHEIEIPRGLAYLIVFAEIAIICEIYG